MSVYTMRGLPSMRSRPLFAAAKQRAPVAAPRPLLRTGARSEDPRRSIVDSVSTRKRAVTLRVGQECPRKAGRGGADLKNAEGGNFNKLYRHPCISSEEG